VDLVGQRAEAPVNLKVPLRHQRVEQSNEGVRRRGTEDHGGFTQGHRELPSVADTHDCRAVNRIVGVELLMKMTVSPTARADHVAIATFQYAHTLATNTVADPPLASARATGASGVCRPAVRIA